MEGSDKNSQDNMQIYESELFSLIKMNVNRFAKSLYQNIRFAKFSTETKMKIVASEWGRQLNKSLTKQREIFRSVLKPFK